MPTTVYAYGVHYKWARRLPDNVFQQLRLAHALREDLVTAFHGYEAGKAVVWARFPDVAAAETVVNDALVEKAAAERAVKDLRIAQRTKNISGPDADLARAREKAANTALRAARKALKAAKDAAYASGSTKDDFTANKSAWKRAEMDARLRREKEGLYHDTVFQVASDHATAIKNLERLREEYSKAPDKSNLVWPEMRHHSFDGTGTLATSLKGRKGVNTRTIDEVGRTDGPHANTFCLPLPDQGSWDAMTLSQQRHSGRTTARFRVTAGLVRSTPDAVAEIPLQVHRLPPEDGVIKTALLVVKKIGSRRVATVNLRIEVPGADPVGEDSTLAVHFGWRREGDDAVRAMTWTGSEPLTSWPHIVASERYPALETCLHVSRDLCSGTVILPDAWMAKALSTDELRAERDESINEIRQVLLDWIGLVGPVPHPSRTDPDTGQPEMITVTSLSLWKKPIRFIRLALDWRDVPPSLPRGRDIADALESWRVSYKRLQDSHNGASTKAGRRRNDMYAQVANLLVGTYGHVVLDEVNHADLARLPGSNEELPKDVANRLNRQRSMTASATLRSKILSVAAREGVPVTKVESAGVSVEHAACGTVNVRWNGKMTIDCIGCGLTYDVDDNAVELIGNRAA